MKKLAYAAVAAIAAILVTLGLNGSAQAYPDVAVGLSVDHPVVYAGESFTATATANVDCAWDLAWNGATRPGDGSRFVTTFDAPDVSTITKLPVTAACSNDPASRAAGDTNGERTQTITVLPKASAASPAPSNSSADLPSTGGPNWIFFAVGLGLLVAGAVVAAVARSRAEADVPAWTA